MVNCTAYVNPTLAPFLLNLIGLSPTVNITLDPVYLIGESKKVLKAIEYRSR